MSAATSQIFPKAINASIVLFPGQGSQYVGMANNLTTKGKGLFNIANQILGYDLLKLCQNGPEEDLNKTIHSQPAVFVSSLAAVEQLAERSPLAIEKCVATAGFSVGEYAALVFAKAMDFVDALNIIKLRAEVTQEICNSVPSGVMTVILGNDGKVGDVMKKAREYCIRSGIPMDESVCSISAHLFPHAKTVGGHQKALDFVEKFGKDFGIRRTHRIPVAGAFHTQLMKPAQERLKDALSKIKINDPVIDTYSNLDAKVYLDANEIRKALPKHISHPVLWNQTLQNLYQSREEMPVTFECGPQNSMITMLGMVNMKAKNLSFSVEP